MAHRHEHLPASSQTEIISANIRTYMKANNLNQKQLADLAGIRLSTLNSWVSGKSHPRDRNLEKLATALHVDIRDLTEDGSRRSHMRIAEHQLLSKYNENRDFRLYIEYGMAAEKCQRLQEINRKLAEELGDDLQQ